VAYKKGENLTCAFSWNKKNYEYIEISEHSGEGTNVYPVHHLLCSSGKLPLGRYLMNAGSESI